MDLEAMLAKCQRDQWRVEDLDWTVKPRPMEPDEEQAIVQYFTDMAGIELLAGALFEEQASRTRDPVLRQIFESFVVDERRHSDVAARLAAHYDVHRYRNYERNPDLVRFHPYFLEAIRSVSAEVANAYITGGELLLDVALLRSLNDYVHDDMSEQAMHLINRDESRHIAVDFYMVEYYASDAHLRQLAERPAPTPADHARAVWAISHLLYYAGPFFRAVLFEPLSRVDPRGGRMREAFKRLQLVAGRPRVKDRPFWRTYWMGRQVFSHPVLGPALGRAVQRVAGLPDLLMTDLYGRDDLLRAQRQTVEQMANEAVALKYAC